MKSALHSAAVNLFTEHSEDELDIILDNSEALNVVTSNTVLIVVDVNRPNFTECPDYYDFARQS